MRVRKSNAMPASALVIDSDPAELATCRTVLDSLGFEALGAASTQEAVRLAVAPRLCLVDAAALSGSGRRAILKLQEAEPAAGLIVLASEEALENVPDRFLSSGWEFLRKPIIPTELRIRVQNLLRRQAAEANVKDNRRDLEELTSRLRGLADSFQLPLFDSTQRELARKFLSEFARNMGAEGGSLFLREEQGLRLIHSLDQGHVPDFLPWPLDEGSVFGRVMKDKKALLVRDIATEPEFHGNGWKGYRSSSLLVFPLFDSGGEISALVSLHNKIRPPFTAHDLELGTIIASLGAEAIHAQSIASELESRETKCRSVFNSAGTALFILDEELIIQQVNAEWEQLTSYTAEEAVGVLGAVDFFTQADRGKIAEMLRLQQDPDGRETPELILTLVDRRGRHHRVLARLGRLPGTKQTIASLLNITRLDESQRALREERDFVRTLIDVSPTFFFGFDPNGKLLIVNRALLEASGYPREYLTGRDYLELVHPEDRETVARAVGRLKEGPYLAKMAFRLLTKSGDELSIDGQARAVWDEDGKLSFLFGIGSDVTLHRKALQALHESESTFRTIVEQMYADLVILDEELHVVYANPSFRRLVGRPSEDLVGLDIAETVRESLDTDTVEFLRRRALQRLRGESVPPAYTFEAVIRGGETRCFEARCGVITVSNGRRCVVAQFMDITEPLRAQRKLQDSEERYRSLVEAAPVGIISVDSGGRIVDVNPALLHILGSPSAAVTKDINMFTLPHLVESGIVENFSKCFETGESRVFESSYRSKWGKESYLRYQVTPLRRAKDRVVQVQAIVEDITQQRALEFQVRHSQKMEALGTLAGGIAHEFNNLLQIIQGYAEMLLLDRERHGAGGREIQEIRNAAQCAAELTQQILMFSRKMESVRRPLDLNEEIRQAAGMLQSAILKPTKITLRLAEKLGVVMGDSAQIHQALTNLALNARDALPSRGKIRIETRNVLLDDAFCESRPGLSPGAHVLLCFSDNGLGMDSRTLSYIFDPFFTTKKVGQGTGLGLSIVYGIIKNHNGHIECRSNPKEGTTFDIYLPVAGSGEQPGREAGPSQRIEELSGGRETILLADDEITLRKLGAEFLSQAGYMVLTAADSERTLALFRARHEAIDLVILDLIMPVEGGQWCLQEILKIKPEQKVIVVSGYSTNTTVGDILGAGARRFLRKPHRLRELLGIVREVLDEQD